MSDRRVVVLLAGCACVAASPLAGQVRSPANRDSVTVTAGPQYASGALHRLLLGTDYRALWTASMRVELLDLASFAGGLTPLRRGGGFQTRSLRFRGEDGREYAFRSVDKDPSAILPAELRETLVDRLVQDQISSGHPVGALVVAPILDAVGVLHVDPRLVVLPDDARLGEFRADFAGLLGFMEERPDENDDAIASFAGATSVIGTERLLERIEEDLEQVDAPAFLAARLTDVYLGDWDRHRDQWRWARFGTGREESWKPIPRDRDQAFVRMDGIMLSLARQYYPQLVRYDEMAPGMLGVTWNGRELDRRFLVHLEWPVWDSVARHLQRQVTDSVIEHAVRQLPAELYRLDGEALARRLRSRRDELPDVARRFYRLLAGAVDVHTSDAAERVEVRRSGPDSLEVVVTAHHRRLGEVEIFRRRFRRGETDEVRLFLHGGADTVNVRSDADVGITVRVLGGGGSDVFMDESGAARLYGDDNDVGTKRGRRAGIDTRDYDPPATSPSQPHRDWGRQYRLPLWMGYSPDVGLLIGMGVERYDFGFRRVPWAHQLKLRAAWGTTAGTYRVESRIRLQRENSAAHWLIDARASGLDILNFHGLGNETSTDADEAVHEVEQSVFAVEPRVVLPVSRRGTLSIGPTLRYTDTRLTEGQLIADLRPYGSGNFAQAGLRTSMRIDGRDRARTPTHGAMLEIGGAFTPALLDVDDAWGEITALATAFLSPGAAMAPTLAVRAGAKKLFGTVPFQDAAYIGDASTVRLGRDQRYGGDALVHANAELRMKLFRALLVLPADVGVFGLADVGRVWLEGESSDRWHDALGGGLWLAFLSPENALSIALARSEERTGLYITAGFAW